MSNRVIVIIVVALIFAGVGYILGNKMGKKSAMKAIAGADSKETVDDDIAAE